MSLDRIERIAGYVCFAASIAALELFGTAAGVRMAGLGFIVGGVIWAVRREIPVGWEGRPPSYFVTGFLSLMVGMAMVLLGIALVALPSQVACLLARINEAECP
jgi:hypothetical protein